MSDNQGGEILTLCGLWANTSKAGNRYMSGRLGFAKIMVFEVKQPKPNGPTHRLCVTEWVDTERERTDNYSTGGSGSGGTELPKRAGTGGSKSAPVTDDEIPFVLAIAAIGAAMWPLL